MNKVDLIQLLLANNTDPYALNDDGQSAIELCDRRTLEAIEGIYSSLSTTLINNRSLYTDVTFTFSSGQSVQAHKSIIAARCDALFKMIPPNDVQVKLPQGDFKILLQIAY